MKCDTVICKVKKNTFTMSFINQEMRGRTKKINMQALKSYDQTVAESKREDYFLKKQEKLIEQNRKVSYHRHQKEQRLVEKDLQELKLAQQQVNKERWQRAAMISLGTSERESESIQNNKGVVSARSRRARLLLDVESRVQQDETGTLLPAIQPTRLSRVQHLSLSKDRQTKFVPKQGKPVSLPELSSLDDCSPHLGNSTKRIAQQSKQPLRQSFSTVYATKLQ